MRSSRGLWGLVLGLASSLATSLRDMGEDLRLGAISFARAFGEFIALAFVWLAGPTEPFFVGGYSPLSTGGAPLDRALQNSLRHEANVSRRSADRHT